MRVLVTGGSGFVGCALVPALIQQGHEVTALDVMLFGNHLKPHQNLQVIAADIRDRGWRYLGPFDAVVHLACIANDPSWELNPEWGKSVNYDALGPLVEFAKKAGAKRFIYASSSSVYGTKPDGVEVTEQLECKPLTDYSKYKALGEDVVLEQASKDFTVTALRPATVCGYSSRIRLDVVVNQMTIDALVKQQIQVHGGQHQRAHLHISDMVRAYQAVLEAEPSLVNGQAFNVGAENLRILDLAKKVQAQAGGELHIAPQTNDARSYTLNSDKIWRLLRFRPLKTVDQAIGDVCAAVDAGLIPDPLDAHYYNLKQMQLSCAL